MKVRLTLKDPDTMHDAVDEAVKELKKPAGVSQDEWQVILEKRAEEAKEAITEKWMEYSEYLTVDFDTDLGTARVVPRDED